MTSAKAAARGQLTASLAKGHCPPGLPRNSAEGALPGSDCSWIEPAPTGPQASPCMTWKQHLCLGVGTFALCQVLCLGVGIFALCQLLDDLGGTGRRPQSYLPEEKGHRQGNEHLRQETEPHCLRKK